MVGCLEPLLAGGGASWGLVSMLSLNTARVSFIYARFFPEPRIEDVLVLIVQCRRLTSSGACLRAYLGSGVPELGKGKRAEGPNVHQHAVSCPK
jgi:hypothetical protein